MLNNLYTRLALAMLAMFILLGLVLVEINQRTGERHALETTQSVNRDIALHAAEDMTLWVDGQANEPALKELAHHVMLINPLVEVYLLSSTGEVLSHALPYGTVRMDRVAMQPIQSFLEQSRPLPIFGDDPRQPDAQKVFSASPILDQGEVVAYLYTVLNGEAYQQARAAISPSYNLRAGQWTIIASLVLAVCAGLIIFFLLTRRLRRLTEEVRGYRLGNYSGRISEPANRQSKDEITELHDVISDMSSRIEDQISAIEQADSTRRELIANVSHDLRTPLAAMQGYLETGLFKMDTLPTPELKNYLETAHKHSRRLNGLINDLFELAKLESPGITPDLEVFSLVELMHDLVQDQQLLASQRGVSLSVSSDGENLLTRADIALVHRALQNLVDNALKNTQAGGHVVLAAQTDEGRIKVEVIDDGAGIPEASLPYLFDRYYQHDSTVKRDGVGLGLAIVKRIIELHDSRITVKSEASKGTVFSFWLPAPTQAAA